MKSQHNHWLLICCSVLLATCQKTPLHSINEDTVLIMAAKSYFLSSVEHAGPINDANVRAIDQKTVLWNHASIIELSVGKGVLVPIQYINPSLAKSNFGGSSHYNLDGLTKLLIYLDSGKQCHAQVITSFPDSTYLRNPRSSQLTFGLISLILLMAITTQ